MIGIILACMPVMKGMTQDTVKAQSWYDHGLKLTGAFQHDSALYYFEKASKEFKHFLEETPKRSIRIAYINARIRTASSQEMLFDYDKSLATFQAIMDETKDLEHDLPAIFVTCYINSGLIHYEMGRYTKALETFDKAILLIEESKKRQEDLILIYLNKGVVYQSLGQYSQAISLTLKALRQIEESNDHDDLNKIRCMTNLASNYLDLGKYDLAKDYFEKCLTLCLENLEKNHPYIAAGYSNLGVVYYHLGQYDLALEYYERALGIRMDLYGEKHPEVANSYHNIASLMADLGKYDLAIEHYQNALEILIQEFGNDHYEVATTIKDLGTVYDEQGNYALARSYFERALTIFLTVFGPTHPLVAESYNNLGFTFLYQHEFESSLEYYKKGLAIFEETYGKKHNEVGKTYRHFGKAFRGMRKYDQSLAAFQQSLIANSLDFQDTALYRNPTIQHQMISQSELIYTLLTKAETLYEKYRTFSHDKSDLEGAYHTFQTTVQWVHHINNSYKRSNDIVDIISYSFQAYEGAIQTALDLYALTSNDSLLGQAFLFAEQSKSVLLREAWKQQQAQRYAGIPDSLIALEQDLSSSLTFYEQRLYEEEAKGYDGDNLLITHDQEQLFKISQQRDSLLEHIEMGYPEYYRLMHNQKVLSVQGIQKNLSPNQTMIEYFRGDSSLFLFLLRSDTFVVIDLGAIDDLPLQIQQLREGILGVYYSQTPDQIDSMTLQYSQTSYSLYQRLMEPISSLLSDTLIIIPDAELGYIPFNALLRDRPTDFKDFSSLPYLLRDFQISYAFSATLLHEMQEKSVNPQKHLLAVAPSFSHSSLLTSAEDMQRGYLGPLAYNQKEAEQVAELFQGDLLLDTLASQDRFLQLAREYRILHLSTHGKVNDQNSRYSFLAFWGQKDSIRVGSEVQYGISGLYLADLYNLDLNADMVVLSACETGLGKLFRGEGIASLARGFSYAGAKSILTTLWSVNDKASADLMVDFYRELALGIPKDQALRTAQLSAVAQGMAPFFWAGFVPMGDMTPIQQPPDSPMPMIWLGGLLLLLLLGMLITIRILRPKSPS